MKKLILGVGLVLTVSVINLFNACSADETDEVYMEQVSKKELLLAKSKEFAKKYGVDMTLREDNLDDIAQSMTVEDMERDFIELAKLKNSLTPLKVEIQEKRLRTLKFRTTTTTNEDTTENKEREEVHTGRLTASSNHTSNARLRIDAEFSWTYSQTKARSAHLSGDLYEDGAFIGNSLKSIPTEGFAFNDSTGVSIDLSCTSTIRTEEYQISYEATIKYSNKSGTLTLKF